MKAKNILFILFISFCVSSYAQEIRGIVVDASGEELAGASLYWAGTTVGVHADAEGRFVLHRVKGHDRLVAAYVGYRSDTVQVNGDNRKMRIVLQAAAGLLDEVVVTGTQYGQYIEQSALTKTEIISFAGLTKMACCNLAESFENSATVTVGYSDAVSGARQIKMLGLAGTYTQILDESRPVMRGLCAPYGLSYTPGVWLNSIQISKGVASVTAGHDAITGQINLEYRKPTDDERLFANFYFDDELRPELNLSTALPVTKDKRLSTVILLHGSADTDWREMAAMDRNGDNFRDLPKADQLNIANKWLFMADNGMELRWGFRLLQENRLGGMLHYTKEGRDAMRTAWDNPATMYGSHIRNRGANGYIKLAMPVGASLYNACEQTETRSNLALVADFDHFDESAYFGLNDYDGTENSFTASLLYSHYFTLRSSLSVGAQARLSHYGESLLNATPWFAYAPGRDYNFDRDEREAGAFAEYTFSLDDRFSIVAGMRGDYNFYYKRFLVTPRGHIKWNIAPKTVFRASAGLGYRSTQIITDNIGMLATGRQILFDGGRDDFRFGDFDRLERALTVGGSLSQTFSWCGRDNVTLSLDYFRTQFSRSVVVDREWSADCINIYSTGGRSYTNTWQADFSWEPITRFEIFATFRYTHSRMTIHRPDGTTAQVEHPLMSRYKALLNLQYATKFRRWVFDATAQLNGPARVPSQSGLLSDDYLSPVYPVFFAQITRKIGLFDLYLGCENIGDYRQKNPVLGADNPFSGEFNSMNVWGPLMGRKFYIGFRMNLY